MIFLQSLFLLLKTILVLIRLKFTYSSNKKAKLIFNHMQKSGPFFIKLGQVLSLRADLIGKEIASPLKKLQDNLSPFSGKLAKRYISSEFEKPIEEIFSKFDEEAIAAASVAQVHKAVTLDGKNVAVKILRPNIEKKFLTNIKLIYILAKIINIFPSCRRLQSLEILNIFHELMKKELDMRFEAASFSEIKENSLNDTGIYIPYVEWQLVSKNILTMEWIDAIPIYNKEAMLQAGCDVNVICYNLIKMFLNHCFRDGFFHGDLHPGNVFVNNKNEIILVDFGITGRLNKKTKFYTVEILKGFFMKDYKYVADIHFEAGYVGQEQNKDNFILACRAIGEPIFNNKNNVSIGTLLALLFKITKDFNMKTQPQLLLLQKTMILVEGLISNLSPEINLWKEAEPWFKEWANANINIRNQIKERKKEISKIIKNIPNYADKIDTLLDIYSKNALKEKKFDIDKSINKIFCFILALNLIILVLCKS